VSTPVISILHATYGRPAKAIEAARRWFDRAMKPEEIEYVLIANEDDLTTHQLVNEAMLMRVDHPHLHVITGQFPGSAPAWDAGAKVCHGQLLIQAQDDLEPPQSWDWLLLQILEDVFDQQWMSHPVFIAVADGYRKDELCCTAIMTRVRMEQEGFFIFPGYISVYSDDETTYRAIRDGRSGRCTFVQARMLTFLHRHAYHDKSVSLDATYQRGNRPEAYAIGGRLFAERNPEAARDGIRTWG
jgi:hypothetical protein